MEKLTEGQKTIVKTIERDLEEKFLNDMIRPLSVVKKNYLLNLEQYMKISNLHNDEVMHLFEKGKELPNIEEIITNLKNSEWYKRWDSHEADFLLDQYRVILNMWNKRVENEQNQFVWVLNNS